jgi:hypothetical protein
MHDGQTENKIKRSKRNSKTKGTHHVAWWIHGHQAYDKRNL